MSGNRQTDGRHWLSPANINGETEIEGGEVRYMQLPSTTSSHDGNRLEWTRLRLRGTIWCVSELQRPVRPLGLRLRVRLTVMVHIKMWIKHKFDSNWRWGGGRVRPLGFRFLGLIDCSAPPPLNQK